MPGTLEHEHASGPTGVTVAGSERWCEPTSMEQTVGGQFRHPIDRRTFLRRAAALSAAAWAQPLLGGPARAAWARTNGTITDPTGTTLERAIVTVGNGPYFSLGYGPGWPQVLREELAAAKPGREGRRRPLTSFLHVTDFQLVDAQSPARVEFFDRMADPPNDPLVSAAQRPGEALVCHTVEALVRQARSVVHGPVTGAPIEFTISTGDNIDNTQANELRWYTTLLNGGEFAPNSGAEDVFEGVQSFADPDTYDPHYWHPEVVDDPRGPDNYKREFGYPDYPGLLAAAIRPFPAAGLPHRWYSAYGNHDYLVQGNVERNEVFEQIAVGPVKVLQPPPGYSYGDLLRGLEAQDPAAVRAFSLAPATAVTPDAERHLLTPREYIAWHLQETGPFGPVGHGFTEDNLDPLTLYYTFEVAPQVRGIVLDTCSPASSEGSIGQTQLDWLEQRLIESHSRYVAADGTESRTGNDDELVVVFSHHRPASMEPIQGPNTNGDLEQRYGGDDLLELLHRFPNVILWANGHSHFNRVVAQPDPAGRTGGFWDVTTSTQIDPPQQARILELVDNRDGTLSIFSTIIDHAAPPETQVDAQGVLDLAAIGREVSYNDYQLDVAGSIGEPGDRNVELLVDAPFRITPGPSAPPAAPGETTGPSLPATGGGLGALAAGAALTGALALRRRSVDGPAEG